LSPRSLYGYGILLGGVADPLEGTFRLNKLVILWNNLVFCTFEGIKLTDDLMIQNCGLHIKLNGFFYENLFSHSLTLS